jgi:hypothetical protein
MIKKLMIIGLVMGLLFACNKKQDDAADPNINDIVVARKNTALLNKLTATWCAPCGSWGWMLNEELIELTGDKAITFSMYNSTNSLFFTKTSVDLVSGFSPFQGWPTFYVNGSNKNALVEGGISYSGTKTACVNAVNDFAELIPIANTGFVSQFKGDQLSVFTKTVFFKTQDTNEQFYLSAYLIENNVLGAQKGKPEEVPHPHVLRAGMTENTFGIPIDVEAVTGNEFTYTFTATPDPGWKRENLYVITIIWRKNGDKYEFVNASRG